MSEDGARRTDGREGPSRWELGAESSGGGGGGRGGDGAVADCDRGDEPCGTSQDPRAASVSIAAEAGAAAAAASDSAGIDGGSARRAAPGGGGARG
eukprot:963086-Rhodomonas_salina.1